jgi:hypothetical protein
LVEKLGNNAFGRSDNLFKKDDVIDLERAKKKNNDLFKNCDIIDRFGRAKKRKCPGNIGIGVLTRRNWWKVHVDQIENGHPRIREKGFQVDCGYLQLLTDMAFNVRRKVIKEVFVLSP